MSEMLIWDLQKHKKGDENQRAHWCLKWDHRRIKWEGNAFGRVRLQKFVLSIHHDVSGSYPVIQTRRFLQK